MIYAILDMVYYSKIYGSKLRFYDARKVCKLSKLIRVHIKGVSLD